MPHSQLIIFDLDDTLLDTSDVYWRARSRFVEILRGEGYNPTDAVELFESIDSENIAQYGFSPDRYGRTMLGAYERFAAMKNRATHEGVKERLRVAGRIVIESMPAMIEGAMGLLQWTYSRFSLALISRGNEQLQLRKVAYHGLERFFSTIGIVADKTAKEFRETMKLSGYSPEQSWVIGDSIRTDINPGLEVGANCIHFRYRHHTYHWRQEHGHAAKREVFSIDRLGQAIEVLRQHGRFGPPPLPL